METKSQRDNVNSSSTEASNQVISMATDERKGAGKGDRHYSAKRNGHSCFEWIQLVATISIPIVIAIYTLVENKSNESIAAANRLKDIQIANISRKLELEIAQANRLKDIEIANISRVSEREIAQAHRLNELAIAEQSRQKDRDLATNQQYENILIEYQSFLAKLVIENGVSLSKNPGSKLAAHFMARTVLNQLDTTRQSILLRSLYDANMITLQKINDPFGISLIDLRQVDLSDIRFDLLANIPGRTLTINYVEWKHLWLPYTILRNASFRYTALDCATFTGANMDSADLSFATHRDRVCLGTLRESQTDFSGASLVNASLYKTHFRFTDFTSANMTLANMHGLFCVECNFSSAILFKTDLSASRIFHAYTLYKGRLPFHNATLSEAVLRGAHYRSINFDDSDWSNSQAQGIGIYYCTYNRAKMENCSFANSYIRESLFWKANLATVDFSNAELFNVSFVNADLHRANLSHIKCEYCDFSNVFLDDAILKNASFLHSNFRGCRASASQLEEAADLSGSTLPNGTVAKMNVQK